MISHFFTAPFSMRESGMRTDSALSGTAAPPRVSVARDRANGWGLEKLGVRNEE